jgi:hypothetical protein
VGGRTGCLVSRNTTRGPGKWDSSGLEHLIKYLNQVESGKEKMIDPVNVDTLSVSNRLV